MLEVILMKKLPKIKKLLPKRNDVLFDNWSLAHLTSGVLLGWTIRPLFALALLIAWEPLEIFILSPILAKLNLVFGYKTLKNSLSDIFFDSIGFLIGPLILPLLVAPPFHFF